MRPPCPEGFHSLSFVETVVVVSCGGCRSSVLAASSTCSVSFSAIALSGFVACVGFCNRTVLFVFLLLHLCCPSIHEQDSSSVEGAGQQGQTLQVEAAWAVAKD